MPRGSKDDERADYIPTPEEIREAAARIRETWTDEEHAARFRKDQQSERFSVPMADTPRFKKGLS